MAGRADCDMAAAWAAGRDACSYCERVRAEQIKHGAKRLRECHRTTTTLDDVAAAQSPPAQSQPAPGPAGWQSGGYGGRRDNRWRKKPQTQEYGGGRFSLTINQQPVAEEKKRKRSDDADDDDEGDSLDRQIREIKRMRVEHEKRKQLRELREELEKEQDEERARQEDWARRQADRREELARQQEWARKQERARQDEADRHEALARQRQRDAYDEERGINESYREENRRGWDRERSRSPTSRSERQEYERPRSPPRDPNSMVDWEKRSKNVQSQLWIVNQRIDRERRARDLEVRATRQAIESVASGGDVDMSAPPTGPRPGGRSRQRQELREQRERRTRG
ncbi:hypothetical protein KC331_g2041 [Hortaea werneckii]|nr:hypothetical protein KC331_g2041 [Hortaea werneckii]KAI7721032.1 hypothetical protein KC353_g1700 [Hortaea werneckii]